MKTRIRPFTHRTAGHATRLTVMLAVSGAFVAIPDPDEKSWLPRRPVEVAPAPAIRPFTATSYWNTKLPAGAPVDARSSRYIRDSLKPRHTQNYLRLTGGFGSRNDYATPVYWGRASDPVYTVTPDRWGKPVRVHIPSGAAPATGDDRQLTIFDLASDQVVGLGNASYDRRADQWSAGSTDRYMVSSNGLEEGAAGSDDLRNFGHRGVPPSARVVRVDEVRAGRIDHRLECYWWATDDVHYWPMTAHETNKGGVVPQGIVIRIKPSIDLEKKPLSEAAMVLAVALREYGCLIGDNSGSGNRLKLELNDTAWRDLGLRFDALRSIPWTEWEFIQAGYEPEPTTTSHTNDNRRTGG